MTISPSRPRHAPPLLVEGPLRTGYPEILSPEALAFLGDLAHRFGPRVRELLARREEAQAELDRGRSLDFRPETRSVRESTWTVAPLPPDLLDRRVEITGPVDRKMVINALNSGANVFMADFEDATSPTWDNLMRGQINLRDAVSGSIRYETHEGRVYELTDRTATLMVRPRGWHLPERHLTLDGFAIPGALVDFGLFFFHNARMLVRQGSGPYFYLPKLQSHLEARLWNEVFVHAQKTLALPQTTIKATVLIETLPAAFEMDEILYELREHSAGLNCGRWDYIFSYIKTFRNRPDHLLPDRGQVTMAQPFMRAYTQLLVRTCHRRNVHAMGGMAAQIPIKGDPHANSEAMAAVRADKLREAIDGHDGTWVAHPALVRIARDAFDEHMPGLNQIHRKREDLEVGPEDLTRRPIGTRTEAGLRHNIRVGVQYLESWLRGQGCAPLYHLMEDAATAEISRTQLWQWLHHRAALDDGRELTAGHFRLILAQEMAALQRELAPSAFDRGRFAEAAEMMESLVTAETCSEFLTLDAYQRLNTPEAGPRKGP